MKLWTAILLACVLVSPAVALAQPAEAPDAGAATDPSPATVPSADDPAGLLGALYEKVKTGAWMPAFGLLLILITAVARKLLIKTSDWFATKVGGYVVAGSTALVATIGGSLAAGQGLTFGTFTTALSVAWMASGGWEMLKDVLGKNEPPAAAAPQA